MLFYFFLVLSFWKKVQMLEVLNHSVLECNLLCEEALKIRNHRNLQIVYCLTDGTFALKRIIICSFLKEFIHKNTIFILISISKNEVWLPWCSTLGSNFFEHKVLTESRYSMIFVCVSRSKWNKLFNTPNFKTWKQIS